MTFSLWIMIAVLFSAPGASEPHVPLVGTVRDGFTGEPVAFANIVVSGMNKGAMSLEDGRFTVAGLRPGIYTITITKLKYEPDQRVVVVYHGVRTNEEVWLKMPPAIILPVVPADWSDGSM